MMCQTLQSSLLLIGEDVLRGEVDVIAKLQQLIHDGHDVVVIPDDLPTRQGSEALSIPVTGILGVVIRGYVRVF
ncbi:MAG: hypothetical protein ACT6FE_06660 [Methanosarcinaceae archaeon]